MNTKTTQRILYFSLLILLIFPLFPHLGAVPIQTWDEARLAVNAYEMLHNHDFIVTHHLGEPDMWNTKPPFLIWLQVLSASLFGISEFSLRFPSALAAFFTCLIILKFTKKNFDSFWLGALAALVLVTSTGYVSLHGTRTADYDALLTFFSTLSILSFFNYLQHKNNKYLYYFFIALSLGVLTKSITILLFTPAFFIYLLLQKELIQLLKNKHFYLSLLVFVLSVSGYYLLRESQNPGYLEAVYNNELGGRYMQVIEQHKHGFWFYYENLFHKRFSYWFLLIPVGLVAGFLSKNQKLVQFTTFLSLALFSFFLVISTAQTKLGWYDLPLFPLLALIVSIPLWLCFQFLQNTKLTQVYLKKNILPAVFIFFVFITPYRSMIDFTYKQNLKGGAYLFHSLSIYLQNGLKKPEPLQNKVIVYDGYNTQLIYYINLLQEKGINISLKNSDEIHPGDTLVCSQESVAEKIENSFNAQLIQDHNFVKTYVIHASK